MADPIDIEAHRMRAVVLRDSDHPALIAEIERLRAVAERAKDVADETFGPFPVQTPEDALSAIEKGCFEARQEYERLRAENEHLETLRRRHMAALSSCWRICDGHGLAKSMSAEERLSCVRRIAKQLAPSQILRDEERQGATFDPALEGGR